MIRVRAAVLVLLCAAGAGAPSARAQVAAGGEAARPLLLGSSDGVFAAFGEPAATRTGWVVFHATRDDGREGIYASAGSPPVAVAETGTPMEDGRRVLRMQRFGSRPTVNDAFRCAFTVGFAEGMSAVVVSQGLGGKYEIVADSREAFRDFGGAAAIGGGGQVVFRAEVDPPNHPDRSRFDPRKLADPGLVDHPERIPPPERYTFDGRKPRFHAGLFRVRGGDLLELGNTQAGLLDLADGFALNESGSVAFRASRRPKNWSLMVAGAGGGALAVAETGARYSSFGLPAIDPRGRVAFLAQETGGDAAILRSRIGGGLPEVVADASDGFVAFGPNVSIDDGGRVAFVGRRRGGREALYVATEKGSVRELFGAGDLVQRRPVAHLRLSNRAFARPDRLALLAQLEPDVEAIVMLHLPR